MYNNDRIIGNRGGVPYVTATLTNAGSTTTNATYTLPDHTFRFIGTAGLMMITMAATATTVTGITFTVNNQSLAMTNFAGEAITTLEAGDHLVSFNKVTNTLKFIV